jgi:hypothetical protein
MKPLWLRSSSVLSTLVAIALGVSVAATSESRPAVALDGGFGAGGVVRLTSPALLSGVAVAAFADGSVAVASDLNDGTSLFRSAFVQKLSATGVVDTGFGNPFTPGQIQVGGLFPIDLEVDASQRLFIASSALGTSISGTQPIVVRTSAAGAVDPGFSGVPDRDGRRVGPLVQVNGGVVVSSWDYGIGEVCLHKFRADDGAQDPQFGPAATPGRVCVAGLTGLSGAFGVKLANGGYRLLAASVDSDDRVVTLSPQGTVLSNVVLAGTANSFVTDIAPGANDSLVIAESIANGSVIRRVDASLAPDLSFNAVGSVPGSVRLNGAHQLSLTEFSNGRLAVAGVSDGQAAAWLFTPSGQVDRALQPSGPRPGSLSIPSDPTLGWTPTGGSFGRVAVSGDRLVVVGGNWRMLQGYFNHVAGSAVVIRTDVIGPQAPAAGGLLRPVGPVRLLDTRPGNEQTGYVGDKPGAGATVSLVVAGRGGIPQDGVGAVVMNLTATQATAPGFVTVWPSGSQRPNASNLNLERDDQTLANLVVAPVGPDGRVAIFTQSGTHMIADVMGWFPTGGGLRPIVPQRILETRPGADQAGFVGAKPGANQTVTLEIAGRAGLPATGVEVAVINLTITQADQAGFVSVWPSGEQRPLLSNLNVQANATSQNLVLAPVGADGRVQIYTSGGGHLIADLVAWLPPDSGFERQELFRSRALDTRSGPGGKVGAGATIRVAANRIAVLNVTATNATAPGFVTVWPSGTPRPPTSNLNLEFANQTIPNLVIAATGGAGYLDIFTWSETHLIVDVLGSFPLPPS